uniref:Cyclase n=1 Tax=Streptomyces versipellis TaxID=67375 RepID=A0A0B6VJI2_9ACTN|nr:hypothetical protein [Streptomyces versipellis]
MSDTVTRSVVIDAKPEKVLAALHDVPSYPTLQDDIEFAEVLESDDRQRPTRIHVVLSAFGLKIEQVLACEHTDLRMSWQLVDGGVITRNDAEYVLTETGDGGTELTVHQALVLKVKMPRSLTRRIINRNLDSTLKALKATAENDRG